MTHRQAMIRAMREFGFSQERIASSIAFADSNTAKELGDMGMTGIDKEIVLPPGKTEKDYIEGLKSMLMLSALVPKQAKKEILDNHILEIRRRNKEN